MNRPSRNKTAFVLSWLGGSLVTAALLVSFRAAADGSPTTDDLPRLLPYSGTLDKDGVGWTGQLDMTFSVYDAIYSGAPLWTETQTVSVYKGAFGVLLGSKTGTTALTSAFESASNLWVGVSLTTSSGTVTLSGRKRVIPVPYAMLTTAVTGADIGPRLVIEGSSAMADDGTTGPVTLTDSAAQTLVMDGDDVNTSGALGLQQQSTQAVHVTGDVSVAGTEVTLRGRSTLVHESDDSLRIDAYPQDQGSPGYTQRNEIYGDTIQFNQDTSGLSASYTMSNSGGSNCADYNLQDHDGDNLYYYFCPTGSFFVGGLWQTNVGNNAKALEMVRCCYPTVTVK